MVILEPFYISVIGICGISVVPSPTIAVNISTSGSLTAGSEYNLTCVVYELFTGLTGSPVATWTAVYNALPGTVFTSSSNYGTVAILSINPLRTSYPTSYTCRGSYFSPSDNITRTVEATMNILLQSKTLDYICITLCLPMYILYIHIILGQNSN